MIPPLMGHAFVLFMATRFFMVPSIANLVIASRPLLLSIYVWLCQLLLKVSANQLKIDAKLVRRWVTHYYLTGEIIFSHRNHEDPVIVMTRRRKDSPEMILELHAFMEFQHTLSMPVNAKTMQTHLKSSGRLLELIKHSLLPCHVAIKATMETCIGLKWDQMSKTEGEKAYSIEEQQKYIVRRRVWIA